MFDRKIWDSIGNKKSCAFALPTKAETLCKNKYNVTQLCNEFSCPLANTKYATVRLINDKIFLFVKEPENCNSPIKMYEKIELSLDYEKALKQLDENLEYWDKEIIHKCKQRMTKMFECLQRKRELAEEEQPVFTVRKTKMNRREKVRALKALNTLRFEKEIGEELMERLQQGIYGEELKDKAEIAEEKAKNYKKKRYVADFEESDIVEDKGKKTRKKKKKETINW
ncbi:mitogen activated protein kinase [Nucleospora cyclopteri]